MRVIQIKPGMVPEIVETDGSLESLQALVGGYIEVVRLSRDIALICDEDGKLKGRSPSVAIPGDVIVGNAVLIGIDADDFRGLTDEEIGGCYADLGL